MHRLSCIKRESGLTLIEVLASITILSICMGAITTTLLMATEQSRLSEETEAASSIAQTEIAKMAASPTATQTELGKGTFTQQSSDGVVFTVTLKQVTGSAEPTWAAPTGLTDVEVDVTWTTSFHGVSQMHQVTNTQVFGGDAS